jgi:hypothetical protein
VYAVRFGADSRRTKRPLQGLLRWGKFTQGKPWAKLSCPFGARPFGPEDRR